MKTLHTFIQKLQLRIKRKEGMTLIEILLVIALLSAVVVLVAKNLLPQFSKGKRDIAKIAIKNIESDLERYYLDCGRFPTTAQGLKALMEAPSGAPECKNYNPSGYISSKQKGMPKDSWQNEYVYTCEDGFNYEIKSLGGDGKEGGEGEGADISSKE